VVVLPQIHTIANIQGSGGGGNVTADPPFDSSAQGSIILGEDIWTYCEPILSSTSRGCPLARGGSTVGASADDAQGATAAGSPERPSVDRLNQYVTYALEHLDLPINEAGEQLCIISA
jgi:hypothetical protein